MNKGFTLVEVLVVMTITVIMTGFMVQNFSRTRVNLNQTTLLIESAIREAQSMALSGSLYAIPGVGNTYRCGYGIHFTVSSYTVYAGPSSTSVNCSSASIDRNYDGADQVVRTGFISNSAVEISPVPPDIFFEPPNPTTYIGGSKTAGPITIYVHRKGVICTSLPTADCRTITVTTAGLITTK